MQVHSINISSFHIEYISLKYSKQQGCKSDYRVYCFITWWLSLLPKSKILSLFSIVLIICVFYRLIRMAADKNAFMEKLLKERQADFDKKQEDYTKLMDEARATRLEVRYFSNFSCMFLNPNIFFFFFF